MLPTEQGRLLYGAYYTDVYDITRVHQQNAGERDSDHFHEGLGFLMQHFKLSRLLERSLQAVDPSLAMVYWDTTIDMTTIVRGLEAKGVDTRSDHFDASLFSSTVSRPVDSALVLPACDASGYSVTCAAIRGYLVTETLANELLPAANESNQTKPNQTKPNQNE